MSGEHAAGEGAVFGLHLDELGEDGAGAELGCVAAIDAAEEWVGEAVDGLFAEVALDEGCD